VFDKVVATATDSIVGNPAPGNTSEFSSAIAISSPWQNPRNHLDVDDDTHVAPGDALAVINDINKSGSRAVPDDAENAKYYVDVSGDNFVAPNDALEVINFINSNGPTLIDGEGEPVPSDLLALLAGDLATQAPRRKR